LGIILDPSDNVIDCQIFLPLTVAQCNFLDTFPNIAQVAPSFTLEFLVTAPTEPKGTKIINKIKDKEATHFLTMK
jgi:hypothetical protein